MNKLEDFEPMMKVRDIYGERGRVVSVNQHTGIVWVRVWAENVPYLPDQLVIMEHVSDDDTPEMNSTDDFA